MGFCPVKNIDCEFYKSDNSDVCPFWSYECYIEASYKEND